ncbi:MAG: hypothetical protein ACOZNI_22740 [Myxococcota bacterium]
MIWVLACSEPLTPDPSPRGAGRGEEAAPPASPAPPGNRVAMTVDVLDVGETIRFMGPHGEQSLPLASPASAKRGDTVQLDCETLADGSRRVVAAAPHLGLGIFYGTVASLDPLVVRSPLGDRTFRVEPWSDLPAGLAVGEYVGAKFYKDGGDVILNVRRFPGEVVDVGVVEAVRPLIVRTLGGPRTHDVAADVAVGDYVAVGKTVEKRTPPLPFTGKMSSWDPSTGVFAMVDAWGASLGVVSFRLDACDGDCAATKPGDLVEVTYEFEAGTPAIRSFAKRTLSPVYFGEVTAIDGERVALTTLQQQPKEVRVTPATRIPVPIAPGDFADVVWRGDPPEALLVVKE